MQSVRFETCQQQIQPSDYTDRHDKIVTTKKKKKGSGLKKSCDKKKGAQCACGNFKNGISGKDEAAKEI